MRLYSVLQQPTLCDTFVYKVHSLNDEVRQLHVQLELDHGCNAEACGGEISTSRNKTQVESNKDTCR